MSTGFPLLRITDLLLRAKTQPGFRLVGRRRAVDHLARVIERKQHNNLLIIGRRGVGKTTLVQRFASVLLGGDFPNISSLPYLELHAPTLVSLIRSTPKKELALHYVKKAFESLPSCVLVIDDAEALLDIIPEQWQFTDIFSHFISSDQHHLFLVLEEEQWTHLKAEYSRSLKTFDTLELHELKDSSLREIVAERASEIEAAHGVTIISTAIDALLETGKQVSSDRAQPDKSLRMLDEVCAAVRVMGRSTVTEEDVQALVANRLGIPTAQFSLKQNKKLRGLRQRLQQQVIGQSPATSLVASTMQRSLLGLKNPQRPMGSFLFMGPSGVGKTELAKVLAREIYGSDKAFIRIDMSEFADAHTAQRLLGAPPGYVGYEAGGQLTNPVLQQPFSLILLDEIEKADASIFDIFLQVLDDGRLTDGQGRTVDFSKTMIIATSNIGIRDIVQGWQSGEDVQSPEFVKSTLYPLLESKFRLEFLNRFEGVTVFQPLSIDVLVDIAKHELNKIEKRLKSHGLTINISDDELRLYAEQFSDPHLGARPLRRFLEERCESIVANTLLHT